MNSKKILIGVAVILILGGVVAAISDFNKYVWDLQASAAASDAHLIKIWEQQRAVQASAAASDAHMVKIWEQQRAVRASMAASDAHMVKIWDQDRAVQASMAASDAHMVKIWDQQRAVQASMAASDVHMVKIWEQQRAVQASMVASDAHMVKIWDQQRAVQGFMAASDAHIVKMWDQHRAVLTVTGATEGFQSVTAAEAVGYINVNVGECVASPEGAMGYHFVNFDLLDLELNPQKPEIMVYVPTAEGSLRLGAVEYAVPIEPWDALYESPPSILGQEMSPNPDLGLYVLHAWIYAENPSGVFAGWNPSISCEI